MAASSRAGPPSGTVRFTEPESPSCTPPLDTIPVSSSSSKPESVSSATRLDPDEGKLEGRWFSRSTLSEGPYTEEEAAHPAECFIHFFSICFALGCIGFLEWLLSQGRAAVAEALDDPHRCRAPFTDGTNSLTHAFEGLLSGVFIVAGIGGQGCGRALRSWCLLFGSLPLICYTAYNFAKSRVYAREVFGYTQLSTIEALARTNFFASIAELRVGFICGLFLAVTTLFFLRVCCANCCNISRKGQGPRNSSRAFSSSLADPLLGLEELDHEHNLATDDFKVPAPLRANPMLVLQDLPMYLFMPFTLLIPGKFGAVRFLRVNLMLQMWLVNRPTWSKYMVQHRTFFYAMYGCFPSMVWLMVYLHVTHPYDIKTVCESHWPPAGTEVSLPVLLLFGSAIIASLIEQLRDSERDNEVVGVAGIPTFATLKGYHLGAPQGHGHHISRSTLEGDSKCSCCGLTWVLPTKLRWRSDRARELKLKRLEILGADSDPMPYQPWTSKMEYRSKYLDEAYVEVLRNGHGIRPVDVGKLFVSSRGVKFPPEPGLDCVLRFLSGAWSKTLMIIVYLTLGSIAVIPNFFRPPSGEALKACIGEGHDVSAHCSFRFHWPNCLKGWFCYTVYVLSLVMPGYGIRLLLDGMKVQRKLLWKQEQIVEALTSMLQGKRAQTMLLPEVRIDTPSDMLAWLELNDLVQELYSLHPVRLLGDFATGYTLVMVLGFAGSLFYLVMTADETSLKLHVVLIVMLFVFIAFTMIELVRVMWAGFCVNIALQRRLKQLNRTQHAQKIMEAHARKRKVMVSSKIADKDERWLDPATKEGHAKWEALSESAELARCTFEHLRDLRFRVKVLSFLTLDVRGMISLFAFFASTLGKVLSTGVVQTSVSRITNVVSC